MFQTCAVVAHFDPDDLIDRTFQVVLDDLVARCDVVILVTTSVLLTERAKLGPNVQLVCRPNIGYDFYSYRVGITHLLSQGGCHRLLLLNSSYLVTDLKKYQRTLAELLQRLDDADIVGVTQSIQWQWHLQSYLLALRGEVLTSIWFQSWLGALAPRNTKTETILSGELALSTAIQHNHVAVDVVFEPTKAENRDARHLWFWDRFSPGIIVKAFRPGFWRSLAQYNPTHFQARALARRTGLIKTELVRNNPHDLDLSWLPTESAMHEHAAIESFATRSKSHYRSEVGALTTLAVRSGHLPWQRMIATEPPGRPGVRVAVLVHVFYPDLAGDILDVIKNIVEPFDLFITTPHEGATADLIDFFAPLASSVTIALSENRGRDVGPFLAVHRSGALEPYDAVLKLHTKKSKYSELGSEWQKILFRQLCGDSQSVKRTLALLRSGRVGMVGPHAYYLSHPHYWGANQSTVHGLLQSLGGSPIDKDEVPLGFFAGTMFWFNPKAISRLHDVPENLLSFEPENGKQDGTLAHALERFFGLLPSLEGLTVTSLELEGRDMREISSEYNGVPVLARPDAISR